MIAARSLLGALRGHEEAARLATVAVLFALALPAHPLAQAAQAPSVAALFSFAVYGVGLEGRDPSVRRGYLYRGSPGSRQQALPERRLARGSLERGRGGTAYA